MKKIFYIIILSILITSCGNRQHNDYKILSTYVVENPTVYIDDVYTGGKNTGVNAHIYYDGHIYKIQEISRYKNYSNELIPGTHLNIPDKFLLVAYERPIFIFSDRPVDTIYSCKYNFNKFSEDIK